MVKQFNDYVVNIPGEEEQADKNYEYDRDKVSQLLKENKFVEAANYCSTIEWNDDTKQQNWVAAINNLKREGYAAQAKYNRLTPDIKAKQDFLTAIDTDGGLDVLDDTNSYKTQFIDYKRKLGSKLTRIGGNIVDEANTLALTFAPEKQYAFGVESKFTDWLSRDNAYNINKFYEMSGLSEEDLKNAGVSVELDEKGYTSITFDKSNPLANKIITNIPSSYTNRSLFNFQTGNPVRIQGYNADGIQVSDNRDAFEKGVYDPAISSVNSQNAISAIGNFGWLRSTSDYLFDLVQDSKNELNEYNKANSKKVYSTIIAPFKSDEMLQIEANYLNGYYKSESDKENDMKKAKDHIYNMIISHSSGQYEYKSDYGNENEGDETLRTVDNNNRHIILQQLKANKDNLEISACVYNGTIGMLVTYGGIRNSGRELSSENQIKTKETKVFIPGLLTKELQQSIDNDISTQIQLDLLSMEENGYSMTLKNGNIIEPPTKQSNNKFVLHTKDGDIQEKVAIEDELFKEYYFNQNLYKIKRNHTTINNEIKFHSYRQDVLNNVISTIGNKYPEAQSILLDRGLLNDDFVNPFIIDDSTIKSQVRYIQMMRDLYDMFINNVSDYPIYNPQIDFNISNK